MFSDSMSDEPRFSYSSGRFLYYEQARLRERYVRFNVSALEKTVAKHVSHGNVKNLAKTSEGESNRVLLATMENGFQAIVKIPFWISVPTTYTIANEVATFTFLHSKRIPPVPEVYCWSSTTDNPVGVEYIVMKHAPGIGADTRWFSNNYMFWYGQRAEMELDRGLYMFLSLRLWICDPQADFFCPGRDPTKYFLATAEKEVKWIEKFGKPVENDLPHNPGIRSPQEYLRLVKKVLGYCVVSPSREPENILSKPTLRHPGTHIGEALTPNEWSSYT